MPAKWNRNVVLPGKGPYRGMGCGDSFRLSNIETLRNLAGGFHYTAEYEQVIQSVTACDPVSVTTLSGNAGRRESRAGSRA